jgi:two-component system nitrate/nitrite response regulator NarL
MKLRIAIADDNSAFLQELVSMLSTDFAIVATAADGGSALDAVRRLQPDVVVLDLSMPVLNGIEVTRELVKNGSHSAVVICSIETDPEIVEAAQQAGALGYVFKTMIESDLITAINAVGQGQSFVSHS